MIERFQGEEGKRRLTETLKEQPLIYSNEEIAERLASEGSLKEVNEGEAFIEQGASDNNIYFIISGEVEVVINGRVIAERYSKSYVGEMAMIDFAATRSATVRARKKSILLEVGEDSFSKLANEFPKLWRFLASELASRLRQRGTRIKALNERPEVFIGSASEGIEIANTIQNGFSHDDYTVVVWTNKIFGPSKTPLESLTKQLYQSDFAILILGKDDVVNSRGEEVYAPRDNVIFELGLFIGRLGKDRVFLVKERGLEIKIPTDLLGIGVVEFKNGTNLDASIGPVCTEIRKAVKELGCL